MPDQETPRARVLIVDDEEAICRIVARSLERYGFDAMSVSDVDELLLVVDSNEYQIILLDRSVDGSQGSSLLPTLRQRAPGAKILFFTGELLDEKEGAAVDGVVQKPINGKELAATLRDLLIPCSPS